MALADQQFRLGVFVGGAALVIGITVMRFCGSVSLPPKPPPPTGPSGTQRQLLTKSTTSPEVYRGFLESDASQAGVPVPSVDDMGRKFAYRVDEARHVLEPGQRPIEVAGLKLHLERNDEIITLVALNTLKSDVAYNIVTEPSVRGCNNARLLTYNGMVITRGGSETRSECDWHDGMSIAVTKVETLEVPPLGAYYLSRVPPQLVGVEERIARGHDVQGEKCSAVKSQVIQNSIERGDITWRDLVDFYARHRCKTYRFPLKYRAFKQDGERPLPAVGEGA